MMKNQLAGLMKQAQQMQENMQRAQEELARTEVEGESGAGLVKIVMTCRHDVKRVSIDPSLLGEDRDMLEDLVAAAFNDALRRAEAASQEQLGSLTAGMPLPSWRNSQFPASEITTRIEAAISGARSAIVRLTLSGMPPVAARKAGARPTGSTTSTSVTKADRAKSSMRVGLMRGAAAIHNRWRRPSRGTFALAESWSRED